MSQRQDVNGVLLFDKPIGLSSNQALNEVKRMFNAKKAGHTGSLDPLANGMLPVCFGEATKFSQFLLEADKQYYVEGKLGFRTETGDAEGPITLTREVPRISHPFLEKIFENFRGEIQQVPSMYSALKFQGKPLYVYARQGIIIERSSRQVTIKELKLLECSQEKIVLSVTCSKGTYIRTLIEDIGEMIGCGAFVSTLRRTYVEPFQRQKVWTLEELKEATFDVRQTTLLPIESAVIGWPEIRLTKSVVLYLQQGQAVIVPRAPTSGYVRLISDSGKFIGIGQILQDGRVAPRRLVTKH